MARQRKYQPDPLIAMFRKAAALRNDMILAGFTDNGGAIHSAERIMNILGMTLNYPALTHINNLRRSQYAIFSEEAWKISKTGGKVLIEHVAPMRALTQKQLGRLTKG